MKALLLFLPLFLLGCEQPQSPSSSLEDWEGKTVTVFFDRNSLGASGSPIGPNTTWLNNTKVSLNGILLSVAEDGIVLDSQYKINSGDADLRESFFWIPTESILTIELRK